MKILIIGGGNMGLTYAKSFVKSKLVENENLHILIKPNHQDLSNFHWGKIHTSPNAFIVEMDLIILAVKPQDFFQLSKEIKQFINPQQVVLSIMAGISIAKIQSLLNTQKVIRSMPNLPSQIGLGMTVYSSANEVTRLELVMVQNLLNSTGKSIYTNDEIKIDAATSISGSGPAYVFYFMNSMIKSAIEMGFTQAEAELMVFQTFKGAVELFGNNKFSCEEWIQKISSKGGTTESAFLLLHEYSIEKRLINAYEKAFEKAIKLGKEVELSRV